VHPVGLDGYDWESKIDSKGNAYDAMKFQIELHDGNTLAEFHVASVDAQRMKTMAAILRDPYRVHWDRQATRRRGLGTSSHRCVPSPRAMCG